MSSVTSQSPYALLFEVCNPYDPGMKIEKTSEERPTVPSSVEDSIECANLYPSKYSHPNQNAQIPTLITSVRQSTEALIKQANKIACSVLGQPVEQATVQEIANEQPISSPPIPWYVHLLPLVIDNSSRTRISYDTHHHYAPLNPREMEIKQREHERNQRILFVGLASIVDLLGAFLLGKAVKQKQESSQKVIKFDELKKQWNSNKTSCNDNNYCKKVDTIAEKASAILDRRNGRRLFDVIQAVGLVAGGTLAIIGSILTLEAIMATGLLTVLGTGTVFVGTQAYRWFDKSDQKDALAIQKNIQNLPK